jgi:receptor protein-tyrosine kinase
MDDSPPDGTIDLRRFLAMVGRRKWLIAFITLLAVGLASAYSFSRTPAYTSATDLIVRPVLTNPLDSSLGEISLQTEMRIVTSAAVADVARELMGTPKSTRTLLKNVSVSAPEDAQILEISYTDPDPQQARRGAQAFSDAYLAFRSQQAVQTIARHTSTLRSEIDALDEQIGQLNEELARLVQGTPEWEERQDQGNALETTRLALQNQLATLSTLSIDPGQVIQPAEVPTSPSSPKHQINLILGLLIGLAVGLGLASMKERLGDRIEDQVAFEQTLEAPVLGIIPRFSTGRNRPARLVTVEEPKGAAAEAFRTLRTNLLALAARSPVKTVLITSAWMGEGKSTTSANLAAALAQTDREVVLISADLRFPRAHAFFGVSNEKGLGQVLTGEISLEEALLETPVPHLRVIPSGPATHVAEPVELLQSDRMRDVIARCGTADFVVIDGTPLLAVADALVLTTAVDGVLFVGDARTGKRAGIARSTYQLRQVGARVLGGVLNGAERQSGRYGGYGYGTYDYRRGLLYRILVPDSTSNGKAAAPNGKATTRPGRPGSPAPKEGARSSH